MSERQADDINPEILTAMHEIASLATNRIFDPADERKADAYRLVGQMLFGIINMTRYPLLVAVWERTGKGNAKHTSTLDFEIAAAAEAAVYVLCNLAGMKTQAACKKVAKETGENVETLRAKFKGLSLEKYQATPSGQRTGFFLTGILNDLKRKTGAVPNWRAIYEYLMGAVAEDRKNQKRDERRRRQKMVDG